MICNRNDAAILLPGELLYSFYPHRIADISRFAKFSPVTGTLEPIRLLRIELLGPNKSTRFRNTTTLLDFLGRHPGTCLLRRVFYC